MPTTNHPTVTVNVPGHNRYHFFAGSFDVVINRYLPASVNSLRIQIAQRESEVEYSDLHTVTECLAILAELDGFGL